MADTADISKIINVIMENPEIIEQISALLKTSPPPASEEVAENPITAAAPEQITSDEVASQPMFEPRSSAKRRNRTQLLCAMKPYLKESRTKAIDTMISIADILDVMRGE